VPLLGPNAPWPRRVPLQDLGRARTRQSCPWNCTSSAVFGGCRCAGPLTNITVVARPWRTPRSAAPDRRTCEPGRSGGSRPASTSTGTWQTRSRSRSRAGRTKLAPEWPSSSNNPWFKHVQAQLFGGAHATLAVWDRIVSCSFLPGRGDPGHKSLRLLIGTGSLPDRRARCARGSFGGQECGRPPTIPRPCRRYRRRTRSRPPARSPGAEALDEPAPKKLLQRLRDHGGQRSAPDAAGIRPGPALMSGNWQLDGEHPAAGARHRKHGPDRPGAAAP